MEISKTSQKLHFRVTKKDTRFAFHFHVLNLFKSWSNLGFDKKIQTWKISKTSQKFHFRVSKKDPCLPFHFHDLNLFKSWSNLGFDQDSNGHQK